MSYQLSYHEVAIRRKPHGRIQLHRISEDGKKLNNYQIGKIQELLDSFVKDDSHSHVSFEFCPKCGKFHLHVIRSGFAGSGKQLYRCTECGRRFSYDHGTVTWYSHQNADQWKTLILDTFEGVGLEKTSRRI